MSKTVSIKTPRGATIYVRTAEIFSIVVSLYGTDAIVKIIGRTGAVLADPIYDDLAEAEKDAADIAAAIERDAPPLPGV